MLSLPERAEGEEQAATNADFGAIVESGRVIRILARALHRPLRVMSQNIYISIFDARHDNYGKDRILYLPADERQNQIDQITFQIHFSQTKEVNNIPPERFHIVNTLDANNLVALFPLLPSVVWKQPPLPIRKIAWVTEGQEAKASYRLRHIESVFEYSH
jgi:hypothetical protein